MKVLKYEQDIIYYYKLQSCYNFLSIINSQCKKMRNIAVSIIKKIKLLYIAEYYKSKLVE